jgi:hypothetical protein
MVSLAFPAYQESTITIMPAVGALDDPAPRLAVDVANQGRLSTATNMSDDSATLDASVDAWVIVSFIEAAVNWSAAAWRAASGVVDRS